MTNGSFRCAWLVLFVLSLPFQLVAHAEECKSDESGVVTSASEKESSVDCAERESRESGYVPLVACTPHSKPLAKDSFLGVHIMRLKGAKFPGGRKLTFAEGEKGLLVTINFGNTQTEHFFTLSGREENNEKPTEKNIIFRLAGKTRAEYKEDKVKVFFDEASPITSLKIVLNKHEGTWIPKELVTSNGVRFSCGNGNVHDDVFSY